MPLLWRLPGHGLRCEFGGSALASPCTTTQQVVSLCRNSRRGFGTGIRQGYGPTANAFEAYGEPLAAGDEFFLIAEFFSTTYCTVQYGVFVGPSKVARNRSLDCVMQV